MVRMKLSIYSESRRFKDIIPRKVAKLAKFGASRLLLLWVLCAFAGDILH